MNTRGGIYGTQTMLYQRILFLNHSEFTKMLDTGNTKKQSRRSHLCVMIAQSGNNFYIPPRNNLGADMRKFGRIGHAIPSQKRKSAGLDYRYALIVNDESDIKLPVEQKIPNSQYQKIKKRLWYHKDWVYSLSKWIYKSRQKKTYWKRTPV